MDRKIKVNWKCNGNMVEKLLEMRWSGKECHSKSYWKQGGEEYNVNENGNRVEREM